jgi:hypothetical protein
MKTFSVRFFLLAMAFVVSASCQQKNSEEHDHQHDAEGNDITETSGNQELYNEVMKIHDEVMPKMEDIHRLKQGLKEKIEKTPNLTKTERIELDAMIARLDSAGEGMMTWMHEFKPLPDSLGEEKARAYLEGEMERVKKVKANILEALEEAKKK